ncbi:GIY-YIG nuclease family protein [Sinorhizobium medicae]|uniref:GIY-YIG nuclease family protein n=1 Tax=Sinorhizobium medicae TaxID=110321 RepID=UPI000FD7A1B7|nr:GIY-YIG nuclease family protein [Sinorhizobium medicae]RVJ33849.1 GIY-YIG nuclease family protein [Sinorhizobium medicae]
MSTTPIFRGNRIACREFLRRSSGHYVYVLLRPDGTPFYVGKGTGERVFWHENESRHPDDWCSNRHKLATIRALLREGEAVAYEIDCITDDEETAYVREAELIALHKRLHESGPLTNLADGDGGSAGPSPLSKERHATTLSGFPSDNPDRALLNDFILGIAPMGSVVLKPLSQFTPRPTAPYPSKTMRPSLRQAVALVASAAANGISMERQCVIPRRVSIRGVEGCIENGVASDIVTSGMATLRSAPAPRDECFAMSSSQVRVVVGIVGLRKCFELGVVKDDPLAQAPRRIG